MLNGYKKNLFLLVFAFAILLFGCAQQAPQEVVEDKKLDDSSKVITDDVVEPAVEIEQASGTFKHALPCSPGKYGTIETVGFDVKTFFGKSYEFCHTKTQVPNPPTGGTGTPELLGEDVWSYQDEKGKNELKIITYNIARYTNNYFEGGATYLKEEGKTCFVATYGPAPKELEDYMENEFKCA